MESSKPFDPAEHHSSLVSLSEAMRRGKLTVVLGPEVSFHAGLPTLTQLIESLRSELQLSGGRPSVESLGGDPFYVAQIFVDRFGREALATRIVQGLGRPASPTRVHEILAKLAPSNIFTTNCDRLMEIAFESSGRPYRVIERDAAEVDAPAGNLSVLTKLYGDIKYPEEIVSTKRDLFDYQETRRKILARFRLRLQDTEVLFVGTSMRGVNLEWLIERMLQEFRVDISRRYILVDDWDESLRQYYGVYALEPIPLSKWDDVAAYLAELEALVAAQSTEYSSIPASSILLSAKRYDEMVDDALRGFEQEYTILLGQFSKGARASIRSRAEELWKRVEHKDEEKFRSTKLNIVLLLAQLCLQTADKVDTETAQSYLEKARILSGNGGEEALLITEAVLAYSNGQVASALRNLDTLESELANKFRISFLMSSKRFEECQLIISERAKPTGEDEEWDRIRAELHMRMGEYDTAAKVISTWVEGPSVHIATLELAARIYLDRAEERHKRFCLKHNLFENYSIVLMHDQLVESEAARRAAGLFRKAGERFMMLDEHHHASQFFQTAFGILHNLKGDPQELDALSLKLDALSKKLEEKETVENGASLTVLISDESLIAHDLKDFERGLHEGRNRLALLSRMKSWAFLGGRQAEAAELIERHWQSGRFCTYEEQTAATHMLLELWNEAKQPEQALKAIRRLDFPKEFTLYPRILEVAYFLLLEDHTGAENLVEELSREYPYHPLALAMLCDYRERQEAWGALGEAAETLFKLIKIPQTAAFYLTALGQQKKWIGFLEALSEAESVGIRLEPGWTHINRARALLALDRDEEAQKALAEAQQLQQSGELTLGAQDRYYLLDSYVRTGELERALTEANRLVEDHRNYAEGHTALIQLLLHMDRPHEAFGAASKASRLFPSNDTVQALYIETGLMAGKEEEVSEALQSFHTNFPDSKVLRLMPKQEAFRLLRETSERAAWAEKMYDTAKFPVIQAVYLMGGPPSFFRFWHVRTRSKAGLYLTNGDAIGEHQSLMNKFGIRAEAVIDFTALLTFFELDDLYPVWTEILVRTFSKLYAPASLRQLIATERASLHGQIQLGRFDAMRRLRNMLDSAGSPFRLIPTQDQPKDYLGPDTEREFARQQGLYYLNEHSDERDHIEKEFGLRQLGDHLSLIGNLSGRQQKKLDRMAVRKKGSPLPRNSKAVPRIVADMMTLLTLEEKGLLNAVTLHFEEIYFSNLGKQWLLSSIGRYEFDEEMAARFRRFENYLKGLGKKLDYVPVSDAQRKVVSPLYEEQIRQRESFGEMSYLIDLFVVAKEKGCCLITDDRFTRRVHFSHLMVEEASQNILRIGSDTLLRFWQMSGDLASDQFAVFYEQLLEWKYLHMPPEPSYLVGLLPIPEGGSSRNFDRAIHYYRDSVSEVMELAQTDQAVAQRLLPRVLNTFKQQLGSALRAAFDSDLSSEQGAELFKGLAFNFFLEYFGPRVPEYLTGLLPSLIRLKGQKIEAEMLERERRFQLWLDQALRMAGIKSKDIDLFWTGFLRQITALNQSVPDPSIRRAILELYCQILPEHRREAIARSDVGRDLEAEGVLKITPGPIYEFRIPGPQSATVITITEQEIKEVVEQRLIEGFEQDVQREIVGKMGLSWSRPTQDSFFIHLSVTPVVTDVDDREIRPIRHAINLFELLQHPNPGLRNRAWESFRVRLDRLGNDLRKWDEVGKKLGQEDEKVWKQAARDSVDLLLCDRENASALVSECLVESPAWFFRAISMLKPEHVRHWLYYARNELTHEDHLTEAAWEEGFVGPQNFKEWERIRKLVFHSMFADAKVVRHAFAQSVFEEHGRNVDEVQELAHDLAHEGETASSPVYKINVVLTIIEISNFLWVRFQEDRETGLSPMKFWRSIADSDSSSELRLRVEALLTLACSSWSTLLEEPESETEQLSIHPELSQVISKVWDTTAQDTNVHIRRFLSVIAGGFITAHLPTAGMLSRTLSSRLLREVFHEIKKWHPGHERSPGFFRPEFWTYLEYHVCFAIKGLSAFTHTVADYLNSNALRLRLLETGGTHKLSYLALGGINTLQRKVLDRTLDTTDTSGIDRFLEQCAGDSINYWSKSDRKKLAALSNPVDPDHELEELFHAVRDQGEESDPRLLIHLMMSLELGLRSQRKGWDSYMARLLEPPVRDLIAHSAELYQRLVEYAFAIVLEPDASMDIKIHFEEFLLSIPQSLVGTDKTEVHFQAVLAFLKAGQNEEKACTWITQMAMAQSIDFQTRRRMIGEVTAAFDTLPDDVRPTLRRVLVQLSHSPEWMIAELLRFEEEPDECQS